MLKNVSLKIRDRFYSIEKRPIGKGSSGNAVGILLYNTNFALNAKVNGFVQELISEGKKVEVLCFIDKEVNRLYDFPYLEVRMTDISLWGGYKNEKVNKFIKSGFDYLYSINNSPFLPFQNILIRSNARLRIGKYFPGSNKYLDVMLKPAESTDLTKLIDLMTNIRKKLV